MKWIEWQGNSTDGKLRFLHLKRRKHVPDGILPFWSVWPLILLWTVSSCALPFLLLMAHLSGAPEACSSHCHLSRRNKFDLTNDLYCVFASSVINIFSYFNVSFFFLPFKSCKDVCIGKMLFIVTDNAVTWFLAMLQKMH